MVNFLTRNDFLEFLYLILRRIIPFICSKNVQKFWFKEKSIVEKNRDF